MSSDQIQKEYDWLNYVNDVLHCDEIPQGSNISWATYLASLIAEPNILPSINAMLPNYQCLFRRLARCQCYGICFDVVQAVVQYANPGQIPVNTVEQPLFAKKKTVAIVYV